MRVPTIEVRNRQRSRRVDVGGLTTFARAAAERCARLKVHARGAFAKLDHIDVVLVSDKRIGQVHQQFMNVAGATDVITFGHGEIVISVDTAARHARKFSTTLVGELQLYILHGLLHLRGFDDRSPRDAQAMARVQQRLLDEIRADV